MYEISQNNESVFIQSMLCIEKSSSLYQKEEEHRQYPCHWLDSMFNVVTSLLDVMIIYRKSNQINNVWSNYIRTPPRRDSY